MHCGNWNLCVFYATAYINRGVKGVPRNKMTIHFKRERNFSNLRSLQIIYKHIKKTENVNNYRDSRHLRKCLKMKHAQLIYQFYLLAVVPLLIFLLRWPETSKTWCYSIENLLFSPSFFRLCGPCPKCEQEKGNSNLCCHFQSIN